ALRENTLRVTGESDRLRDEIRRLTDENHGLRLQIQEALSRQTPSVEAALPTLLPVLEQLNARLVGRMYVLAAEVGGLRRQIQSNGNYGSGVAALRTSYLDLLEAALTGSLYQDPSIASWAHGYDEETRAIGRDWPARAQTM